MNRLLMLFFLLGLVSVSVAEESDEWRNNRIALLDKITVGPWDNFQATVSRDDQQVVFTRDRNQIPNLFQLDPDKKTLQAVLRGRDDAKDATFSHDGKRLLFTRYRRDAQGNICLLTLGQQEPDCFTDSATIDHSPFWVGEDKVAYLRRSALQLQWQLVLYDLNSKQDQVLFHGNFSSATASVDGRYLLLSEITTENKRQTKRYDFEDQSLKILPEFDLPGISGFQRFSNDGQWLYFSRFMSDTNNDQLIDGNDNGVIFRIPWQRFLHAKERLLPEQLTSVSNNCKFPELSDSHLYLTCAFEGSLDIYRTRLQGVVPQQWGVEQLWEAHRAARSHAARLLILNTLRYRFPAVDNSIVERILSHHLDNAEFSAARYYLAQLQQEKSQQPNLALFYQSLNRLLAIRSSKQKIPVGIVTARFQRWVKDERQQLQQGSQWPELKNLVHAYLDYELEQQESALQRLNQVGLQAGQFPLEGYLAFELYKLLLQESDSKRLLSLYPEMFNHADFSLEAQLYYAFHYLKLLAQLEPDLAQRQQLLTLQKKSVVTEVQKLFALELAGLTLVQAAEPLQQQQAFARMSQLLRDSQHQPLLRKVAHIRAIQILAAAERYDFMELMSRSWLLLTHISEMEFINSRDQYATIMLDKAYGLMQQSQLAKAYNTFYSAIRQTDDLEAHYQLIELAAIPSLNKKENLKQVYELLEKQKLLAVSAPYVQALQLMLDEKSTEEQEAKALALLQTMDHRSSTPAMQELLMGVIYHRQLRRSQQGYRFDQPLFQQAHHHYMMALDFGRENQRINAVVWENLAHLHLDVRHYGLASGFFQHRLTAPFLNAKREANLRWFAARALFYSNQPQEAQQQAEQAYLLAKQAPSLESLPFLEKWAFYTLQAEHYIEAEQRYKTLLAQSDKLSVNNQIKARLAYAYALKKQQKNRQAVDQYQRVLQLSAQLKPEEKSQTQLLKTDAVRYQLLAHGFLAQLNGADKAVVHHQTRIALWQQIEAEPETYAYSEASRLSFLCKDQQQLALTLEQVGRLDEAFQAMNAALHSAAQWSEESENSTGPVIYRSLVNGLSFSLLHPEEAKQHQLEPLGEWVNAALQGFESAVYRSEVLLEQEARLRRLWERYSESVLGQ
ncbi:MAG: hypothetical protein Q9O24_09180 [Gammaproteobacteria bacterium]|nr:hypothetical protein [Gammaproteobacteria bacterium]